MNNPKNYQDIQIELQEGRLSEALDLLLAATEQHADKDLKEDLLLIKSKFEYNRNQYEIKGVLTDQEFNIQYSKATLGAQDILHRLKTDTKSINAASSTPRSTNYRPILIGVLVIALAGIGWWGWRNTSSSPTQKEELTTLPIATNQEEKIPDTNQEVEQPEQVVTEKPAKKPPKKDVQVTEQPPETHTSPKDPVKEPTPTPPPPAKTFEVNIIRNSDMSDADIFVDGQKAIVVSSSPIITTIQISQKQGMHLFELRKEGADCKRELLITKDQQKINFNCN